MFSQLFGGYLVEKGILSHSDYESAIKEQLSVRVKLGTIAIADKLLTEEQVETINQLQKQFDKRFGDIAVEKGLLTDEQVGSLLKKQGNPYMQFLQILMESGKTSASALDQQLDSFQHDKGFSNEDMTALKNDDIDGLIPIFAISAKPYVTELAGLVIRNINRFVTRDFYFEKIQHLHTLNYRHLAGQKTFGSDTIYLALAEESAEGSFVKIASEFSGEEIQTANEDAYDAVCEFINVNNGLFASEASKKKIQLDMEPTFAYENQTVEGDFYALPIYLEGKKINLIIAVNSEVKVGDAPLNFSTSAYVQYQTDPNAKGTVMLVDDSKMSRNMLRAILEENGYSVIAEAANGEEALDVYKQKRADIITLDVTMPKMDGIEALKNLIAFDPSAKIIMITAAGQESKLIEALKCGAKKFVTKPFEKEEVLQSIENVLNN